MRLKNRKRSQDDLAHVDEVTKKNMVYVAMKEGASPTLSVYSLADHPHRPVTCLMTTHAVRLFAC